jgi:hypothetical protein
VPELWIDPGRYTFVTTNVGQSDGPHTFAIYNDDNSAHQLLTPFLTNGDSASFSLSDPGSEYLLSDEATTFDITFTPVTDGLLVNNITVTTLEATTPMTISVEGNGLTPLCEGDFEPDGDVDGSDLNVFIAAYTIGSLTADLDSSGVVDTNDLAIFAAEFSRMDCP